MTITTTKTSNDPDIDIEQSVKELLGCDAQTAKRRADDIVRIVNVHIIGLDQEAKLKEELSAIFVMLLYVFAGIEDNAKLNPNEAMVLTPSQRVLLMEVAQLTIRLGKPEHNPRMFWRSIVLAMRAECLYLLGDHGAAVAAAHTADAALELLVADPVVDAYRAYLKHLIANNSPHMTTSTFVQQLCVQVAQA